MITVIIVWFLWGIAADLHWIGRIFDLFSGKRK